MILVFLTLLFSFGIMAQDDEVCDDVNHRHTLSSYLATSTGLPWHPVSDAQGKLAHCLKKTPYTLEEMPIWLNKNQSTPNQSKKINGISFSDESPENLRSFEILTKAINLYGEPDPSRQKTFTSQCKKVDCAVKEIFGSAVGTQLLFMQRKFGFNGSHISVTNSSLWKKTELDTILLTLSDLPEGILPMQGTRPLVHWTRGTYRSGNPNEIANSHIRVFDVWNEQPAGEKRPVLLHELGHVIAEINGIDSSPEWMKLSGWSQTTKVVKGEKVTVPVALKPESIVSGYGLSSPEEDFAESVSAYRYNPQILKKKSPEKYALIKETVFDNVEFTSEESCSNPVRNSEALRKKAETYLKTWEPTEAEYKTIASKCTATALAKLSKDGSINMDAATMRTCYAKEIALFQKDAIINQSNSPYKKFLRPMVRNIKPVFIPEARITAIASKMSQKHRTTLKDTFTDTFKTFYGFDSECKTGVPSLYFKEPKLGIDRLTPIDVTNDLDKITWDACKKIANSGSLRRWANLDYSETEITDQVNMMIK